MSRIAGIIIGISMAAIAGSVGAVLFFALNASPTVAALSTMVVFIALAHLHAIGERERERAALDSRIDDLTDAVSHCMRKLAGFNDQFEAVDAASEKRVKVAARALHEEIGLVETALRELADTVDAGLSTLPPVTVQTPRAHVAAYSGRESDAVERDASAALFEKEADGDAAAEEPPASTKSVRPPPEPKEPLKPQVPAIPEARKRAILGAIAANRIDVYLQPIVTLPQRKVRYYEATLRLRLGDGKILTDADFYPAADAGGVAGEVDQLALFRSVQIVRRLSARGRSVGIVCRVSSSAISETSFLKDAAAYLDTHKDLKETLILEFAYPTIMELGPVDEEFLKSIVDLGFKLSVGGVDSLRIDAPKLADLGVQFLKVDADLLLQRIGAMGADIHPADLAPLLARYGIDLIAGGIQSENTVVDLLDFEAPFAQGDLFSVPRPVRSDIISDIQSPRLALTA